MEEMTPSKFIGILVTLFLGSIIAFFVFHPEVLSGVSVVVTHNFGLWVMSVLGISYAIYRKFSNPREMTWIEFPVQIVVSICAVYFSYCIFFYSTSGMQDWEIWNGYVQRAEYYEEWTEKSTTTDSEGKTHTTYTYHPPEWQLVTSNKENIYISSSVYRAYVNRWKNEKKENLFHMDQSSIGDGDMYFVSWSGDHGTKVPSAVEHLCVNYLKASGSIRKRTGSIDSQNQSYLNPYPRVFSTDSLGPINVNRVVVAKASVPEAWKKEVDHRLDDVLSTLGKQKEVNVLVYVMGTADQRCVHALEEHWTGGKKNDVIVTIGASKFPQIDWVSIIAWTDVEEFKILLRDRILSLKNLEGKEKEIVEIIADQISKTPQNGGFKRRPMEELVYLVSDIRLPWWSQLIVILLSGLCAFATSWALEHNELSE